MAQLEHIEAIEKRLWSAADTLRANSNYASNEYFLPVMGLVFLRHAYSRYLGVRDSIEANLPKRGGKTRPLTKEDFSRRSAIFLRPEAQFADPKAHDGGEFFAPDRYVGVAPEEEDFEETPREIHVELEDLNTEAAQRAATIKRSFEEMGI